MPYIDGFVLPVPKKKLAAYLRMSRRAGKIWREYGAAEYIESVGDDLGVTMGKAFPGLAKAKPGEAVVFSWIKYTNRRQRDQVNKKVIKDPRIAGMMQGKDMPFDVKRMAYGGFKIRVDM